MRYLLILIGVTLAFFLGSQWDPLIQRLENKKQPLVFPVTEHKPFVVIIPSYNNSEWVEKNLRSVLEQKYDNYRVVYIDDASEDRTYEQAKALINQAGKSNLVQLIHNATNLGALHNTCAAVHGCENEEIVVICDGDDWFAHDRVLQHLNEYYANPDVWLTYGSYIEYPTYSYTVANFAREVPLPILDHQKIREYSKKNWSLSHLRTFYAGLFKQIRPSDFIYEGEYLDSTADLATMIPMVEMVGSHAQFIDEVLYIYNRATALNDHKVRPQRQREIAEHIFNIEPYQRISSLHASTAQ